MRHRWLLSAATALYVRYLFLHLPVGAHHVSYNGGGGAPNRRGKRQGETSQGAAGLKINVWADE